MFLQVQASSTTDNCVLSRTTVKEKRGRRATDAPFVIFVNTIAPCDYAQNEWLSFVKMGEKTFTNNTLLDFLSKVI